MATRSPTLTSWVKNAYGMELGLVTMLEQQTKDATSEQFKSGVARHLEATRRHAELLRNRLQSLGENPSTVRAANPLASLYGQNDGGQDTGHLRTELMDFVTESFEIASYQALAALARNLGDEETVHVCEQILNDEKAMVSTFDQMVPELRAQKSGERSGTFQDNVRIARESFESLNAHDLDRWSRLASDDYQGEAPATTAPMNRKQNIDYIGNFFKAFPDLHFELLRTIASGEHVVIDWSATGTQSGPLISPDGKTIPPTGRRATEYGSSTFEFKDGKIRRSWVYFDMSALMDQLGLVPRA